MNFGVDLSHGDAEFAGVGYSHGLGQGEWVYERCELKNVQHGDGFVRSVREGRVRCLVHVAHLDQALCEAVAGAMEEAKSGGLLQETSAGRTGIGQRVGSGIVC